MSSRAAIKALSDMIDEKKGELPVEKVFAAELDRFIETSQAEYKPSTSYNPSGMGCVRALYFKRKGYPQQQERRSASLIGITESGKNRHETLQSYIIEMAKDKNSDLQWVDVEEYIKSRGLDYLEVLHKTPYETKLCDTRFDIHFLCDGIIKYKDKYYILEIKTETSSKFRKHDEAQEAHKLQAWCYSMSLQIRDVMFLYECRDYCTRKPTILHVSELDWDEIADTIKFVEESLKTETVPMMPEGVSCKYCSYTGICNEMMVNPNGRK